MIPARRSRPAACEHVFVLDDPRKEAAQRLRREGWSLRRIAAHLDAALGGPWRSAVRVERMRDEIARCVVRCANCHRRRSAHAGGYYRARV
jgi:hypothetical protein